MADLPTTNYGWIKPDPAGSDSTWGTKLNSDLDGIDSQVHANQTAASAAQTTANAALPKSGGTLTGALVLSGNASTSLNPVSLQQMNAALPAASSTIPVMNGVAAVGTGTTWARADHVHPVDTSRYAASNPSGFQTAAQVTASLGGYLPLTGGTASGQININYASPTLALNKTASGQASQIFGLLNGTPRWLMRPGDESAESGSNAGSNFVLYRYNDAGAVIDSPLNISRANGQANFGQALTVAGAATFSSTLTVNGTATIAAANVNGLLQCNSFYCNMSTGSYQIFPSGNLMVTQFSGNWYWGWNNSTGALSWNTPNGPLLTMNAT
jgi:hypothetical protein